MWDFRTKCAPSTRHKYNWGLQYVWLWWWIFYPNDWQRGDATLEDWWTNCWVKENPWSGYLILSFFQRIPEDWYWWKGVYRVVNQLYNPCVLVLSSCRLTSYSYIVICTPANVYFARCITWFVSSPYTLFRLHVLCWVGILMWCVMEWYGKTRRYKP